MSREIKFRIWDDEKKEWLGASSKNSLTFYGFHLVGEVMTVQCPPQWALDPQFTVEQYIGLKDRNGEDIYEGDLVEYNGVVYEIYWDNEASGWDTERVDSLSTPHGADNYYTVVGLGVVVGNVHEGRKQ